MLKKSRQTREVFTKWVSWISTTPAVSCNLVSLARPAQKNRTRRRQKSWAINTGCNLVYVRSRTWEKGSQFLYLNHGTARAVVAFLAAARIKTNEQVDDPRSCCSKCWQGDDKMAVTAPKLRRRRHERIKITWLTAAAATTALLCNYTLVMMVQICCCSTAFCRRRRACAGGM